MLKVFIGYDPKESIAWHVHAHSIYSRSSIPISIIPLNLNNLKKIYNRPIDPKQTNLFSFSRFLSPYLSDFDGFSVYFDCDMLMQVDIAELLIEAEINPGKAVYVVKHDYEPKDSSKYLGTKQLKYPRKNWSSMILWDCGHKSNACLTADYVEKSSPMHLHRFLWLKDEEIGELDKRWNWLIGEYDSPPKNVANIHWTLGGPYFNDYADADCADLWNKEKDKMLFCEQIK
jgi:hypothetical protein